MPVHAWAARFGGHSGAIHSTRSDTGRHHPGQAPPPGQGCFPWGRVRLASPSARTRSAPFGSARTRSAPFGTRRDRGEPRSNCPPRVLSRNLWRGHGSRQPAPDKDPCPIAILKGVHPLTGCSPHVGSNSFEVNRAPLQEAKPRQPACARAFGLGGPRAVGRRGRHCDCTIGDPMAEASPAADTCNASAYSRDKLDASRCRGPPSATHV